MNWARELAQGLVSSKQMEKLGFLNLQEASALEQVKQNFDFRVPASFLEAELEWGSELVPELRNQVVPSTQELVFLPEELADPIGDEKWTPVEGVTHRYPNRVLLKVTYQCAVYCRFCFRRYKVSDSQNNLSLEQLEPALAYIESHPEIWEVILTGGDPLVLSDKKLAEIISRLAKVAHVKILRFHTRIPTALPSRVTPELLEILKSSQKSVWIVAHINSASELSFAAKSALAKFSDAGFPMLAQSVLLKGVNNSFEQLAHLFTSLVENRVKPYYLHYPDLAQGTQHFRIPLSEALSLVESLRGNLSGTCLPQLVVDIPGGHGKVPVEPQWAKQVGDHTWEFISPLSKKMISVTYPPTP